MKKIKGSYKKRYEESYKRITSSPEFKRSEYARLIRRKLIVVLISLSLIVGYLGQKFLGVSEYLSYGLSAWVAIVLIYLIADKKAAGKI